MTTVDSTSQDIQVFSPETLLKFKEAQDYLRVSRSTLYRLMWSGELVGHKVGSTWRFFPADLQACVQAAPLSQANNGNLEVVHA